MPHINKICMSKNEYGRHLCQMITCCVLETVLKINIRNILIPVMKIWASYWTLFMYILLLVLFLPI